MLDVRFLAELITLTLADTDVFPAPQKALPLLLGTAAVESSLTHLRQIGGPARGLWQIEGATEKDHARYIAKHPAVAQLFRTRAGVVPVAPGHLECNLVYSLLMCRLHYYLRDPDPLPEVGDIEEAARRWKKYYNCGGKGTVEKYLTSWETYIAPSWPPQTGGVA